MNRGIIGKTLKTARPVILKLALLTTFPFVDSIRIILKIN